jgi:hypothetical protein
LDFFFRAFQRPYPPGLSLRGVDPPRDGREQESEEKDRPHGHGARLLRGRLVMKVLL